MALTANSTIEFHPPGHKYHLAPDFTAISIPDEAPIADALSLVLRAKKKSIGSGEQQLLVRKVEQFCKGSVFGDLRAIQDDNAWKNLDLPLVCRVYLKHLVQQACALTTQQLLECEFNNGLPFDWKSVQDKVTSLLSLGFNRNEALEAIMVTDNKQVELAAQYLLNDNEAKKLERERAKRTKRCAVPPNRHYTIIEQSTKERQEKEKWIRKSESELQLEIQRIKMQITSQKQAREELENKRNEIAAETRLTLYEEYIRGLICDPEINVGEQQHMERYRQQRNITNDDHKTVLKNINITEDKFDGMKTYDDTTTNEDECVVCYEPPKDHMLLPCNHVCLCPDCAEDNFGPPHDDQVCPLCSHKVEGVKQVFYF